MRHADVSAPDIIVFHLRYLQMAGFETGTAAAFAGRDPFLDCTKALYRETRTHKSQLIMNHTS